MKNPLVSIITPVYNVEPYIIKYLDSVINQTYGDLEIICINDGSSDRCGEILDEYAKKDARLTIIHQNNAGYPNAINRGLEIAAGDYITFFDPDDWAEHDYYEKVMNLVESTHADIVVSSFYREYPDKSLKMKNAVPIPELFCNKDAVFCYGFEADVYRGFKMFLWNKLFRSHFFISKEKGGLGFRMEPDLNTGGDVLLTAKCFLIAKSFACTSDAFYHYRIRDGSLVRNADFTKKLGLCDALERIVLMLERESFDENVINLVRRFHTYYSSQLAEFAHSIGDQAMLDLSKILIGKYLNVYRTVSLNYHDRLDRINRIMKMSVE